MYSLNGKVNDWKLINVIEIAATLEMEIKIKEEKTSSIQSTCSLHTVLLIANQNLSFLINTSSFLHGTLVD